MDARPTHFGRVREPFPSSWYCPDSGLGAGPQNSRAAHAPGLAVAAHQGEVASS